MFTDGTTICPTCHKRVHAEAGLCQLCGTVTETRTLICPPAAPEVSQHPRKVHFHLGGSVFVLPLSDLILDRMAA